VCGVKSKSGLSALAELMRNSGAALHGGEDGGGNAHMRNRKGKLGLRKTHAFQENDRESENENENGKENETAGNGSLGSGSGASSAGGKRSRLLASFEKGSRRGKREPAEEREFKYVLTHPPWYVSQPLQECVALVIN
jgi:hypothetical protein